MSPPRRLSPFLRDHKEKFFLLFHFSVTVDIRYYTSFRCTAKQLDIYIIYEMTPLPGKSSTNLTQSIVVTMLLAAFPVHTSHPSENFVSANLYFLSLLLSHPAPKTFPSGDHQFVLCIYKAVSVSFAYFVL